MFPQETSRAALRLRFLKVLGPVQVRYEENRLGNPKALLLNSLRAGSKFFSRFNRYGFYLGVPVIDRYTRPEMGGIWTEENKLKYWLEVELVALEALAQYGYTPKNIPPRVRKKAGFDIADVKQIEEAVKHDIIAFLSSVAKKVGPDGRYIHFGLTSSDVLDTAMGLQVRDASKLISAGLKKLVKALAKQARKHKYTLMGSALSPSFLQTKASTRGSTLAKVQTAPEIFPKRMPSAAASKRSAAREISS